MRKIGVVGIGAMGAYEADIQKRYGNEVTVYDKDEGKARKLAEERGYDFLPLNDLVSTCDTVEFAVPILITPDVISYCGPLMKPSAAIVDLTSRKTKAVGAAIKKTDPRVEIYSVHYNFRPSVSAKGKKVITIPVRPSDGSGPAYREMKNILTREEAIVKEMIGNNSVSKHDLIMDLVQGLAHTKHMVAVEATSRLLKQYGMSFADLMEYTTAFYELTSELDGRIIDGNPELYIPLQLESDNMPDVLDAFLRAVMDHAKMVGNRDWKGFRDKYDDWKKLMGDYAKTASAKTDRIIGNPLGIEVYCENGKINEINSIVKKGLSFEPYKDNLFRAKLPSSGEVDKLIKSEFAVAKATEMINQGSMEGQIVFFIKNKGEKTIMLSPYYLTIERNYKDKERVQLLNRFHDPYLNAFSTWSDPRVGLDKKWGALVAYNVTR